MCLKYSVFKSNLCKLSHIPLYVLVHFCSKCPLKTDLFVFKHECNAEKVSLSVYVCVLYINIYFQENSFCFNCSNIFCLPAEIKYCSLKLSF